MATTMVYQPTLEQQLAAERRLCPQCKLEVKNPFVERCPRCFSLLPHMELGCQGCIHNLACPAKHEHDTKQL